MRLPVNRTGHVHVTSMHMRSRAKVVSSSRAPNMRVKGEGIPFIVYQYALGEPVIYMSEVCTRKL